MKIINSLLAILLIFISSITQAYEGKEEAEYIFSQIKDITSPSLEDYLLLQDFLFYGERPYLKVFDELSCPPKSTMQSYQRRSCRNLRLIGDNYEMPVYKIYHVNSSPKNKERCIVLYASFNSYYPSKVKRLVSELKNTGYQGHIILRIGGYPNLLDKGLLFCHIPYAWKICAIMEAKNLGYKNILWLDAAFHPISDLNVIFKIIKKFGYLFIYEEEIDFDKSIFSRTSLQSLGMDNGKNKIPHILGGIIGFNVEIPKIANFLQQWQEITKKVKPNLSTFPEELPLSVLAWRNSLRPVCRARKIFTYDPNKKNLHFFHDSHAPE
ncbi:MAG: hypothetical protein Tsb0015_07420 [Simkaniaceae bacterium]